MSAPSWLRNGYDRALYFGATWQPTLCPEPPRKVEVIGVTGDLLWWDDVLPWWRRVLGEKPKRHRETVVDFMAWVERTGAKRT